VDQSINYQTQRFEDEIQAVDVVLDTVGGDTLLRSYGVLRPGGRLVTIVEQPSTDEAERRGIHVYLAFAQPSIEYLTRIAEFVDAGRARVFVSRTFPLEEAQAALDLSRAGEAWGKLVLTVG
jgi:NADPH:quinone reductase-like Zn-dependent oxidoreductase